MIELHTLGTFDVRASEPASSRVLALPPKRAALLIYLLLARPQGMHRRDTLLGMFWPESGQERARRALSQAMYMLKGVLGEDLIRTEGHGDVGLKFDRIRCDALTFRAALAAGDRSGALCAYAGDLLPGFHVSGCLEFEHWLDRERLQLRQDAVAAAIHLAEDSLERGNPAGALSWLRTADRHAPYDEELVRRRIELMVELGDPVGAIREYRTFAIRLADELELTPSAETVSLIEGIRAGLPPDALIEEPAVTRGERHRIESEAVDAGMPVPARGTGLRRNVLRVALLGAAILAVLLLAIRPGARPAGGGAGAPDTGVPGPARVLVLPFTDEHGESGALGRIASDWVTQGLVRSGLFQVVAPTVTQAPPAWAGGGAEGSDATSWAASMAAATGATQAVTGSYFTDETGELVFEVRIQDTTTGRVLHSVGPVRGTTETPLQSVDALRQRVTGALAAINDARLADWSSVVGAPPSLEAYHLYVDGIERYTSAPLGIAGGGAGVAGREASSRFRRAFELDTTFTAALIWAVMADPQAEAAQRLARLEARRETLPPWERHMTDYLQGLHRRDNEMAYRAMRRINEMLPQSEWAWHLATLAHWTGRPRTAIEALDALDPDRSWWMRTWPLYCSVLIWSLHNAGQHDRELDEVNRCAIRYPQDPGYPFYEAHALAALGRPDEAAARLGRALAEGTNPVHTIISTASAIDNLRSHGHPAAADRVARAAIDWYERRLTDPERAAIPVARWGELLYAAGEYERVTVVLRDTVMGTPPSTMEVTSLGYLALAEARLGNIDKALRLWDRLEALDLEQAMGSATTAWARARVRLTGLLHDPEQAVRAIATAWDAREVPRVSDWPRHVPELVHLHDHPGFLGLVRPRD